MIFEETKKYDDGTVYRQFIGDSETIPKSDIDRIHEELVALKGNKVEINGKVSTVTDARVGSYCNLVNRRYYKEVLTDEV